MKRIRKIRIGLSIVVAVLATTLIVAEHANEYCVFQWVKNLQFMQAAMSFNLAVCAGWLILTFIFGRAYCSAMCPLGTFQDAVAWIYKRIRFHGKGHYSYSHAENRLRYVILGIVVVCMTALQWFLPLLVAPYEIYQNFFANLGFPLLDMFKAQFVMPSLLGIVMSILSFLLIGGLAFKHGRTYCNTICPVGSLLGIASRRAVFQLNIDPDLCTSCGLCRDECKASCIDYQLHTIDNSRCVMCFNCIDVCPADAIRYSSSRNGLSTPLMQAIEGNTSVPQVTLDTSVNLKLKEVDKRQ